MSRAIYQPPHINVNFLSERGTLRFDVEALVKYGQEIAFLETVVLGSSANMTKRQGKVRSGIDTASELANYFRESLAMLISHPESL